MNAREAAENILHLLALDPMVTHERKSRHDWPPEDGWHTRHEIVSTVARSIESVDGASMVVPDRGKTVAWF